MIGKDRFRNSVFVTWDGNNTVRPAVRALGAINAVAAVIKPHDGGLYVCGLIELCC